MKKHIFRSIRFFLLAGAATGCLFPAAETAAYDFANYVPTLDRRHALAAQDPAYSPIDSGYTLRFISGANDDYDFISYEVTKDNNVTPVYYKINYSFDGGESGGEVLSRIVNSGERAEITGYFKDTVSNSYRNPGAVYNMSGSKKIDLITADFINNGTVTSTSSSVFGGALVNGGLTSVVTGNINGITGDFIGNYVINNSNGQSGGGAVTNLGTIRELSGNFINNHAKGTYQTTGGALLNIKTLGIINGTFIGNYAEGSVVRGGAVYNTTGQYSSESGTDIPIEGIPTIPLIKGDFIGNYGIGQASAFGGAISNVSGGIAPDIYGNFIGNYVSAKQARAGAVDAPDGLNTITGNFIGNHADSKDGRAYAGAIYTGSSMRFVANGLNNYFIGNYTKDPSRGKIYNAIMVDSTENVKLTFDITGGGNLYFNDNINSFQKEENRYDIDILGYGSGKFFMNNYIMNAGEVTVKDAMLIFNRAPYTDDDGCGGACRGQFIASLASDGRTPDPSLDAVTSLNLNNSQFYLHNDYIENVKLKNYTVNGNSLLHIDVTKENGEWTADKISLSGKIEGTTRVVVYDRTNEDNRGASVLFIEAPNDKDGNKPGVFRVYGSPYKWDIAYNHRGEKSGSYWYLVGSDEKNDPSYVSFVPDPIDIDDPFDLPEPDAKPEVTPETVAYQGLPAAAIEQTRSMAGNVRNHAAADKFFAGSCGGVYSDAWNGKALKNFWISPVYHTASIDSPVKIDADINGLEAGFDIQRNLRHRLGIFASYRQGDYELDGQSDGFRTYTGADIDIDSYGAGLYYRYDYRRWQVFGLVYGGIQQADVKSDDGVGGDSDGAELSGSLEVGYLYDISDSLKLEPGIGIAYTQVDFDDLRDSYGKTASYGTFRQTELTAGIKLEKYLPAENGSAKLYFKPSVIQLLSGGDNVAVSGLRKTEGLDDATLGRVELGGRYGFSERWSAYGWTNYTFGSDYEALSFGAGFSYAW